MTILCPPIRNRNEIMRFLAAIVATLLTIGSASAANLSSARCEDQGLRDVMLGQLKEVRLQGGGRLASKGVQVEAITRTATKHASRDKLICEVTVRIRAQGRVSTLRGRVTYTQFDGDKITSEWSIGY